MGASEEKEKEEEVGKEKGMVSIYIMGKRYEVPMGLTILKAMEYSGYRLVRGVGCRGGFCGACSTVYRKPGDYRLRVGLACQTTVEDGMYLTQIPFYPAVKATYSIDALRSTSDSILRYYPEVTRCVQCNTCRKVCPQELEVMRYIAAINRGQVERAADLSFDCISCGLCASRCPAEIVHYHVGMLARRLHGKHNLQPAMHVRNRIKEIEEAKFDAELARLMSADRKSLSQLYSQRDIEPEELVPVQKTDED